MRRWISWFAAVLSMAGVVYLMAYSPDGLRALLGILATMALLTACGATLWLLAWHWPGAARRRTLARIRRQQRVLNPWWFE